MSEAQEIEARAARYAMRRSDPEWGETEERELQQWLAESMAHKAAFWRLEHGWARVDRIAMLREMPAPQREVRFWRSPRWLGAMAAAVLALGCGALFVHMNRTPDVPASVVAYATPPGAHRIVTLPDRSIVELNTASAIESTVDATRRRVRLQRGEAYFAVEHDSTRPFVVEASGQKITVLGTKFAVRMDGAKVTVAVLEGRVRLQSEVADAAAATLTRGHVATVDGPSVLIASRAVASIEDQLAWRGGLIRFDGATLEEVAAEFNRYNSKQLVIQDSAAAKIAVGGTFQYSNVDAFVRLLQRAYGLHVETTEDELRISSQGRG
jgi:transmembrane sensor